ncbi:MAG: hypothetical protein V1495_11565 [Pseudomonadota bacterium]
MKRRSMVVSFGVGTLMLTLVSCGSGDSNGGNNNGPGFNTSLQQTLPVFQLASSITALQREWTPVWGNTLDELKVILVEETSGTNFGTNNIYHQMNDMDGGTSQVTGETCDGTTITGIQSVPFFTTATNPVGFYSDGAMITDFT